MSGPLSGVKIIELAGIGPGPYACMLLADMGADILRIERGNSNPTTNVDVLSRSRPSVTIDLKSEAGRDLILELCEQADVLIEGFRPGVTERLGLGPDDVLARNPRLVYGRMTGYGQTGPLALRAGHDINYIAVSGALWPIGRAGGPPVPPLNLVGDFGGGSLFLALGVVAAVLSARTTGEGQIVDAAMVDGSASMLTMTHGFLNQGHWAEERGTNLLDSGAPFYDVYETKDGKYMAVGSLEPQFYAVLLHGLGLDDEALPAQYDIARWPELRQRFTGLFRSRTRDEWTETFEDVDACVTPVLSPREAAHHPYNVAREVFDLSDEVQPNPAPRFSKTPGKIDRSANLFESGAERALARWGIDLERQRALQSSGAFGATTS